MSELSKAVKTAFLMPALRAAGTQIAEHAGQLGTAAKSLGGQTAGMVGQGAEALGGRVLEGVGNIAGDGRVGQALGQMHGMGAKALGGAANLERAVGGATTVGGAGALAAGGAYAAHQMGQPAPAQEDPRMQRTAAYHQGCLAAKRKLSVPNRIY